MTNDKSLIPDGQGLDIRSETDLDVPDLPGDWSWSTANHYHWNHKVNVFFGLQQDRPGGWYGEIDNYVHDGEERWTVHIRPIVDDGTDTGIPRGTAETAEEHRSLDSAIQAVPANIMKYYPTTRDQND